MMQTRLAGLAALVALALGGTARADTISLVWQGTRTATALAAPSGIVTADIVLTITSSDITSIGWNVSWDDELSYVTASTTGGSPPPGGGIPGTNWLDYSLLDGTVSNTGSSPGTQATWKYSGSFGETAVEPMSQGTATVGTITFHVNDAVATDGIDVAPNMTVTTDGAGCFAQGVTFCSGRVAFHGAAVNLAVDIPVPEPGTGALLTLGLAGICLVGRRSRS